MNDKVLHFLAGGGILLSVSFGFDFFGGPEIKRKDTVKPAYFFTVVIAAMKEADDEFRAPLSNDAREHAADITATVLGAIVADVGVRFIRSLVVRDTALPVVR